MVAPLLLRLTTSPQFARLVLAVAVFASVYCQNSATHAADASRQAFTAAEWRELNSAVLAHIRDGDAPRALKALEPAGEQRRRMSLVHGDPLSPASGGLSRLLAQTSSEEQFDLLKRWTLPSDQPAKVRLVTSLVSTSAPPAEFARSLGERPRPTSFAIATIGDIEGIASSAWMLVASARDCGKLKRLIADIEPLVKAKVDNADLVWMLSQLADRDSDASPVMEFTKQRIAELKGASRAAVADSDAMDPAIVVLLIASMERKELQAESISQLEQLIAAIHSQPGHRLRPFLQRALVSAVYAKFGGPRQPLTELLPPKYWIPVSGDLAGDAAVWLVHEKHLMHVCGSGVDQLVCRIPIEGEFQVRIDAQFGPTDADGGLAYGGMLFQPHGTITEIHSLDRVDPIARRTSPFLRQFSRPTFNQLSLHSDANGVAFAVNRHPVWADAPGEGSPWLGLTSHDNRRPVFRHLTLTGTPKVSRAVSMAAGTSLRGWQTFPVGTKSNWRLSGDVVECSTDAGEQNHVDHVLSYVRSMQTGEAVSCEFFHAPGATEFNPSIGRVAFQIRPDGVRLHWITEGQDEWTGLTSDNSVIEPLNRRGPRPLPLRSNDWNRLVISLKNRDLTLTLNDVEIYQRRIDWKGERRFGLQSPSPGYKSQVRTIVMTGDWPQSLPPDFRDDPWTSGEEGDVIAHLSANGRLLPDTYRAEDVFAVRHHAAQMTPEKRFEYLTNWILPADSDHGFHMTGEFAVVDQTEPRIVSPVFDWLETARQLGKLQECREKLLKMNVAIDAGEYQHRSHAALLMLVNLELSDSPAAAAAFEKLLPLLKAHAPAGIDEMWPETLLADAGARRFPTHAGVNELLTFLHTQRTQQWKPAGANLWHAHLAALYSRQQFVKGGGSEDVFSAPANLKDWIPVSAAKSSTRGPSYPTPLWHRTGDSIHKLVGHEDDFLYYRLPLAGDLSVECDLMRPSQHPSQVLLAGFYVGPRWDAKHLEVGTFRGAHPHEPVDPPFTPFGPWLRYRGVIHGDRLTVYLNGREVVSESLPMPRDPWIGIRCWSKHHGRVKDVRITGQPTVLQGVPLTDSTDLTGWVSYHEEAVSNSTGRWVHTGDPESSGWIVGKPNPALAGTSSESLLRYQRPLVEGGSVEYEFFYEPGVFETHPALDRLALMIQPDGIHEHRITDGRFERTDAGPAESVEIPRHRRGPAKLPLRPKDWNRVSLQLQGDMLALLLNDVVVYERPLESNNLRTFGLFHYADQGEVRVRRAVMRGAWGKNLPPLAEQELASPETRFLDEATPKLRSLFTHSFQKSGLPDKYFKVSTRSIGAQVSADQRGVQVNQSASGAWSTAEIAPRFHVYGDFDLVAAFTDLQPETDKDAGIMLVASVAGERNPNFRAYRRRAPNGRQELQSSLTLLQQDGSRSYHGDTRPCESTSGRLRLSRRGDKVHYLFADGDSDNFQLTGSESCPQGPLENDGVKLLVTCNGEGSASVTWTRLEIQAERMTWLPAEAASMPLELQVIGTDGRGLRTIATPDKAGYTHLGSPEWSADGKTIVLDMSAGSTTNSHIVLLNADGSDLKDVGTGCMPSLSADGRRIVFSEANTGVMMMNADGSGRELIDPNSWGVQWSPDGKWIAYCKSGNIVLMDAVTRKTRPLLVDKDAQRYDMIYWNLGWSHDSRLIGFKGRRRTPKGDDLAVVNIVKGEPIQILTPLGRDMIPDCTFSADNQRLIFAMPNPATLGPQLYSISLKQPAPPQLLTTLPADHKVFGVAMSRDGKRLVITSQQSTPPVEWIDEVTSGTVAK